MEPIILAGYVEVTPSPEMERWGALLACPRCLGIGRLVRSFQPGENADAGTRTFAYCSCGHCEEV